MNFVDIVWTYYRSSGRQFVWRSNPTPYNVFVSEVMLQQTQTSRVVVKYEEFLKLFPTIESLAAASLQDVLRAWQGLGYNRRGKYLHDAAQLIIAEHQGRISSDPLVLKQLPGIGEYTSSSIPCFAYNIPTTFIETNIRTVYLHHFFQGQVEVADKDILPLIARGVDQSNPREWYYALMDYGVHLKSTIPKNNHQSKHYTKQSKFEGSNRQVRSTLLRMILQEPRTIQQLQQELPKGETRIVSNLKALLKEGVIAKSGELYLPL